MSALLAAQELAVRIGAQGVCCGLDFELAAGEIVVILGKNGAGKSTLLATLAGLRPPSGGQVLLQGRTYAAHGSRAAARLRGWLGQHRDDPFASTVLESALAGRHPHLGRWQWEGAADVRIAREALVEVGLHGLETRDVQTLSGGERQRLAIATLLTQAAPLMLLDEPLTHLDLNHQIAVLEILARRARQGAGIIAVLHDPGLAWRYAQRVLLLYGNGHTELGPADTLLTPARLERLYGHPLARIEQDGRVAFIPI